MTDSKEIARLGPSPYPGSEYERRNLLCAGAYGAKAALEQALDRARVSKSTPKWLFNYLEGALARVEPLGREMSKYRDLSPDAEAIWSWSKAFNGGRAVAQETADER